MTVTDQINAINVRIAILKTRKNGLNGSIVKKLERKRRALEAKINA